MNTRELALDRFRLKLIIMSDADLWWLFHHHRDNCSREFWEEVENRKAAGTLSKSSPFWSMGKLGNHFRTRGSSDDSNVIELTREEWEARRRRKMFQVMSA